MKASSFLPPPVEPREINEIRDLPPSFIRTEDELKYYHELYDILIKNGQAIEERDKFGLGMLAFNYAQVDTLSLELVNGVHLQVQGDRQIVSKKNPAIDAMEKVQQQIKFWSKEFRMTPNSRGKTLTGSIPNGGKKTHSVLDRIKVNQPGR